MPGIDPQSFESGLDKVGHLMAFTALAVSGTWLSSIPRHVHRPLLRVIRLEVLQLFVPRCDALTDDAATLNEKVDAMLTAMMQLKG